jgi:formylglycine-generating enzyme required for sulfatase activity/serine/threonine protein kinase
MSSDESLKTSRVVPEVRKEVIPGTVLQQRYRLQRLLDSGGMGQAWLATDATRIVGGGAAQVVIKLLPFALRWNESAAQDFAREYGRVWLLSHPHICKLFDMGQDPQVGSFQVMQFLSGVTIRQLQQQHPGGVDRSVALRIVAACADGLDYAHQQKVIHRDVKPENVMYDPATGTVHLIDFGLAAEIRESLSRYSQGFVAQAGTERYMSPEQWLGQLQNAGCDQWALGVMAWELLTGAAPYHGSGMTLGFAVCQAPVPKLPSQLSVLQPVFERVLRKQASDRYGTCREFVEELTGLLQPRAVPVSQPVAAVVPPVARRSEAPDWEELLRQLLGRVQAPHDLARQFLEGQRYAEAVAALEVIPEEHRHHLDSDLYRRCVSLRDEVQELERQVDGSVKSLQTAGLRGLVQRLLQLQPWREDLQRWLARLPEEVVAPPQPAPVAAAVSALVVPFSASAAKSAQTALSRQLGQAEEWSNDLGMKFRLIPGGTFAMGSPAGQGSDDERPQHKVTISRGFSLGVHTVTQGQWQQLMGTTRWQGMEYVKIGETIAATYISWEDSVQFCQRLSARDGRRYRLPTEAEWEWSCRAGTTTQYSFGDREKQLGEHAWYGGNGGGYAKAVGQKLSNAFGLYDMHGNVWEWCSDEYDSGYYGKSPEQDPAGPSSGSSRVLRGGGWHNGPIGLRSCYRLSHTPGYRYDGIGLRVLCELE